MCQTAFAKAERHPDEERPLLPFAPQQSLLAALYPYPPTTDCEEPNYLDKGGKRVNDIVVASKEKATES